MNNELAIMVSAGKSIRKPGLASQAKDIAEQDSYFVLVFSLLQSSTT